VAGYEPHITEKHKEYGPIVIDFDFVQSKDNSKRFYTTNTITNIVKLYNQVIKKYLDIPNNSLEAYVTEKEKPILKGGTYRDGIHIVYPYICTKPPIQMVIRDEVLQLIEKNNTLKRIPLVNDLEDVIDKNVIYHSGWLLYGSRKNTTYNAYRVTHIYNCANGKLFDTIIPGDDLKSRLYIKHFINVLSCRRFFSDHDITPLADNIDPEEVEEKIGKIKDRFVESSNKNIITDLMGDDINFIKAVAEDVLAEARNLTKLFSKKRATDKYSWLQVGRCLHNIDYRLLEDWIIFSKKCPEKFKVGECEKLWKKMKQSNYTMASLHYFANADNPGKYYKMKEGKLNKLVKDGMEASHTTIAKLLLEKYKFKYKCASIKHNIWYEFKDHRWQLNDSAHSLRNLISAEIAEEYANQQRVLHFQASKKTEQDGGKTLIDQASYMSKVIRKLHDANFKNGVIRECADMAYDPNFLKNIDENCYLICFENGVYDLEADNFRDGCPDDYISLCTGYKYMEYDENDEYAIEINSFLKKIQTDKVMREYLLKLLSTCLAGSISEENFYVLTGSGANGKSKLMELLKYTLGDYFKPMDIRLLTEKRASSSAASPELADKKGIRACPFDEPKSTDEINTGFMKIFTGGDQITARALFKEPIYFKPQFKPFLLCNHLPNIKSDDDGTWRRIKVIPFLSKFVKPADATKKQKKNNLADMKDHFWADILLSEKIPEWKQIFMSMLIKYYKKYRIDGLVHPELVTRHTAEYKKRCDIFQDFIGDYLEKTDNVKDAISIMNLHEGMRSWYRANYDGRCPNAKDLRSYMTHRMNTFNTKTDSLTHYKIKTSSNDNALDDLMNIEP